MLSPITASQWDFGAAAHLLVRAGFGADPAGIEKTFALGPDKAVVSLLRAPLEDYPPPIWAQPDDQDELRAEFQQAATPAEKQMAGRLLRERFISEMRSDRK